MSDYNPKQKYKALKPDSKYNPKINQYLPLIDKLSDFLEKSSLFEIFAFFNINNDEGMDLNEVYTGINAVCVAFEWKKMTKKDKRLIKEIFLEADEDESGLMDI